MNPTALVTGASGQLGQLALRHLLDCRSDQLAAATRTPQSLASFAARGVDVRFADFDVAPSLLAAFAGITDLLLISTGAGGIGEARVRQHAHAVCAAVSAGVQRVVYTSLLNADLPQLGRVAADHLETERLLAGSGLRYVSLRNAFYMEMLLDALPPAIAKGEWVTSAAEGPIAYVTRFDCANAAATALGAASPGDACWDIAGEPVGAARLLAVVEAVLGVRIALVAVDQAEHIERLAADGVPPLMAKMMAHIDSAVLQGAMAGSSRDFIRLTGRLPTDVGSFLAAHRDTILERAGRLASRVNDARSRR